MRRGTARGLDGPPSHAADAPPCPDGTERYAEYDLFFGRGKGGAEAMSDDAWARFLAREVTPRFPDGLTVLDGFGQKAVLRVVLSVR